jgi:hypothetical protein
MSRPFLPRLGPGILALVLLFPALPLPGADDVVDFASDRWAVTNGRIVEHLGRKSLAGSASLKDALFGNGVVEVDVAVTGARSYPGVLFRMESPRDFERVYLRPHRAGPAGYPDAVQYVPGFNGVDGWQLYNGPGFTAAATMPTGQWVHLRIEVKGTQARVFLGDATEPVLRISDLKRGATKGTLGLSGPPDGSAYFSAFRYRADDTLVFPPPPHVDVPPGLLTEWKVSKPFKGRLVDREAPLSSWKLESLEWVEAKADPGGLVDIARLFGRLGPEPDAVVAKAVLRSDSDRVLKVNLGYSDEVSLYLNGKPLFHGASAYRQRDPSFLGIVGLFDAVYLPLKKGANDLTLLLTEAMGGWGFIVQDATATYEAPGVAQAWTAPGSFPVPETVVYDPGTGTLFVSGYDGWNRSGEEGRQFVSRLGLDGKVLNLRWAEGLRNPVGLAVSGGSLWVVETGGIAEIEIATGKLLRRIEVPGAVALNDLAVAKDGTIYLSDSGGNALFRIASGKAEEWLRGDEIARPNGLHLLGSRLIVGNNGDGCVKSVDLATKEVRTIADLGAGIIDGIESDAAGDLLVSHNEGRLFRITPSSESKSTVTKLLDTSVRGVPLANFAFLAGKGLAVFPTFTDNRVVAYRLPPGRLGSSRPPPAAREDCVATGSSSGGRGGLDLERGKGFELRDEEAFAGLGLLHDSPSSSIRARRWLR